MRVRAIIWPWIRKRSLDGFWEDYRNSCLETEGPITAPVKRVREPRSKGHLDHPDREVPRTIWDNFADMGTYEHRDETQRIY